MVPWCFLVDNSECSGLLKIFDGGFSDGNCVGYKVLMHVVVILTNVENEI